ncbi:MAG: endonuclease/exonuclease/phosphatase family protein [bacterium]
MCQLCVLTVNLRREDESDGPNNWPHRRALMARLIREAAPVLFGTQEGRRAQIEDLHGMLSEYAISDRHRNWDLQRFYPSIFYRPELLDLLSSGDRWLSETPELHASKSWGSAFPRLATWARFRTREDRRELLFACAHLDHIEPRAREGQARALADLLAAVNPDRVPLILVGDFNDVPGSRPYAILTSALRDAWLEKNPSSLDQNTWHGFSGKGEKGRLDWILVSRAVQVLSAHILRTSYADAFPSDHFPVRADLTF